MVIATIARTTTLGSAVSLGMNNGTTKYAKQQQDEQRHAAEQLDVDDAQPADEREFRPPAERQQQTEREAQRDPGDGEEDVEHQAAPLDDGRALGRAEEAQQADEAGDRAEHEERSRPPR